MNATLLADTFDLIRVVAAADILDTLRSRTGTEVAVTIDTNVIAGAAPLIHVREAGVDVIDLDPAAAQHLADLLLFAAMEATV